MQQFDASSPAKQRRLADDLAFIHDQVIHDLLVNQSARATAMRKEAELSAAEKAEWDAFIVMLSGGPECEKYRQYVFLKVVVGYLGADLHSIIG